MIELLLKDIYCAMAAFFAGSSSGTPGTGTGAEAVSLVKYAEISSTGSEILIPAVAGKILRILNYVIVSETAVGVRFDSYGAIGPVKTPLTGSMTLLAGAGISSGYQPYGQFETFADEAFYITLSAAGNVNGHLSYVEIG